MRHEKFYSFAYRINELLCEYVNVHDDFFSRRFSIREIIPIPFIFKPIDYSIPVDKLDRIIEQLTETRHEMEAYSEENGLGKHPFYITATRYVSLLCKAVKKLRDIQYKLHLKAQGEGSYSYKEYNKELDLYQLEVFGYSEFGNEFNKEFRNLRWRKDDC
jgi:hypothetical protein